MSSELSTSYSKYIKIRDEILKHKWIESEKVGKDIGFEQALIEWIGKHRTDWIKQNLYKK